MLPAVNREGSGRFARVPHRSLGKTRLVESSDMGRVSNQPFTWLYSIRRDDNLTVHIRRIEDMEMTSLDYLGTT